MATRFLGCFARRELVPEAHRRLLTSIATANPPLSSVVDSPALAVIAAGARRLVSARSGVVLGDLFERGRAIGTLSPWIERRITDTAGASLIDDAWGNYVVLLEPTGARPGTTMRAPFGTLPCYLVERAPCVFVASDLALLRATGLFEPRVDGAALRRYLLNEDLIRPETCVRDLQEVPGGWRATFHPSGIRLDPCWSPWPVMRPPRVIDDASDAAIRLRGAIDQAVGALIPPSIKSLLRLSGGLDSSIVAAALKADGRETVALTFTTAHPASDERRFARLVANHLAVPLSEHELDLGQVDLQASDAAQPRPAHRAFEQASRALARDVAARTGADTVVDGGGGDQLFCSIPNPRLVADCLAARDADARFWPAVADLAALSRSSLAKVAWHAWRNRHRSKTFRFPLDVRFLTEIATADRVAASTHPWLDPPNDIPPGRAAHAALVAAAMALEESPDHGNPIVSPLISQPVAECCLAIPSWMWIAGGRDRSAARAAFAERLPSAITGRRSKGSPDSFLIDLYDARRRELRDMLLDGRLAAIGLFDRAALARTLDDRRPVAGPDFYRILRLADAEAWACAIHA